MRSRLPFAILCLTLLAAGISAHAQDQSAAVEAESRIAKMAQSLDEVLGQNFHIANRDLEEKEKLILEPPVSDAAYLRRAYLILLGRNPTFEESRAFLGLDGETAPGVETPKPNRLRLVRELTESREFAHQQFRRWVARLELAPDPAHPAQAWLLTQMEAGAPLNQWTVNWFGKYTVPFLAPDAPVSSKVDFLKTAKWMEAFVGKDLSCAACHDHPFENLYQKDFIALAGFFNDQGATRAPESYHYTNPKEGEPIPATTFFGETRLSAHRASRLFAEKAGGEPWPNIGSARMFGEWLVTPESVAFDLKIVDRGWRRVFGVEFLDRIDYVSKSQEQREGQNLVDRLVEILHAVQHDYGKFLQVLMTSRIAQLKGVPTERSWPHWRKWVLTGPVMRELTFDERHRSLIILETGRTDPDLDEPMNSNTFRPEAAWLTSADIERQITGNPLAAIRSEIKKAESDADALALVFLSSLARPPSEDELATMLKLLGGEPEPRSDRMARALWAHLMSEEFTWVP